MQSQLFILAITCYLVSLVATLTGSFFVKLIPAKIIIALITFHFLFLAGWIFLKIREAVTAADNPGNYLFLAFFCLGIIASGIVLRSGFPVLVKLYFSLFLLSLPVFVVAPSRVLGFIVTGNFSTVNPKKYHLTENYFLVEQGTFTAGNHDTVFYKLIREMGMFHFTLTRNIPLPEKTDSVSCLNRTEENTFQLRVYFKSKLISDSLEMQVIKDQKNTGEIKQVRQPENIRP